MSTSIKRPKELSWNIYSCTPLPPHSFAKWLLLGDTEGLFTDILFQYLSYGSQSGHSTLDLRKYFACWTRTPKLCYNVNVKNTGFNSGLEPMHMQSWCSPKGRCCNRRGGRRWSGLQGLIASHDACIFIYIGSNHSHPGKKFVKNDLTNQDKIWTQNT